MSADGETATLADSGGSQPSVDPYLLAQWDFSDPYGVDATNGVIYARAFSVLAADVSAPGLGLNPLGTQNQPIPADCWPTLRRVNGKTVFVQTDSTGEWLQFAADAPSIRFPDLFFVQEIDAVVDGVGIYGSNGGGFISVGLYDNGDDIVWAVWFFVSGTTWVIRTTTVVVDTSTHVVALSYRGAETDGLYIDGTLFSWQEADPAGWDTLGPFTSFDFYWAGTQGDQLASAGAEGAYCETRIYQSLAADDMASVSAVLATKWGVA